MIMKLSFEEKIQKKEKDFIKEGFVYIHTYENATFKALCYKEINNPTNNKIFVGNKLTNFFVTCGSRGRIGFSDNLFKELIGQHVKYTLEKLKGNIPNKNNNY